MDLFDQLQMLLESLPSDEKQKELKAEFDRLYNQYATWEWKHERRKIPMCEKLKNIAEVRMIIESFLEWLCGDPDNREVESNFNFNSGGKGLIFCHRKLPEDYYGMEVEITDKDGHDAKDRNLGDVMAILADYVPDGCHVGIQQHIPEILDEYFGIDQNELEKERQQLLEDQLALNDFHDRIKKLTEKVDLALYPYPRHKDHTE